MSSNAFDIYSIKYIAASFIATYCSGLVHPLDVIKTRFQSHDGRNSNQNLVPKYGTIKNAFVTIYKEQGFRGLYKGFYVSLLCQASAMAFFFWLYQIRKTQFEKRGFKKMNSVALASVQASIIATLVTQPIWVVKTRMLLSVDKNLNEYQNFIKQFKEIKHQYGVKGFLKGLQLSLILSFSGVLQMYSYEGSKMVYEKLKLPESKLEEKHFICGGFSKIFSVFMSYPFTTIRTRIQQNQYFNSKNCQKYESTMQVIERALKQEGISGLYKGVTANMMRGVSQKGIYFYFYQIFKDIMIGKQRRE